MRDSKKKKRGFRQENGAANSRQSHPEKSAGGNRGARTIRRPEGQREKTISEREGVAQTGRHLAQNMIGKKELKKLQSEGPGDYLKSLVVDRGKGVSGERLRRGKA